MEVCGSHTMAIARFGLKQLLPDGVELISGPGCPVCVTANAQIDTAIALARRPETIICSFGDMLRVPGSSSSLANERAHGADVRVVYSPADALDIAACNPAQTVVFIGVGFETTAPLSAATIKRAKTRQLDNFCLFCAHKLVPPALASLAGAAEVAVDAFLLPGHVSTVIGLEPYRFLATHYHLPGVVSGFSANEILQAVDAILHQLVADTASIENAYPAGVREHGNPTARALLEEVFQPVDCDWRGLGQIEASGLALRAEYASFDACRRFPDLSVEPTREARGCRCGDVLKGLIKPTECPLFDHGCSPLQPIGPCMVSSEGSCAAAYKYRECS
jgi:hydrogenase expression/formation protein HypD